MALASKKASPDWPCTGKGAAATHQRTKHWRPSARLGTHPSPQSGHRPRSKLQRLCLGLEAQREWQSAAAQRAHCCALRPAPRSPPSWPRPPWRRARCSGLSPAAPGMAAPWGWVPPQMLRYGTPPGSGAAPASGRPPESRGTERRAEAPLRGLLLELRLPLEGQAFRGLNQSWLSAARAAALLSLPLPDLFQLP